MARQETIRILRSEVLSATPSLTSGEVAVNLADRKFFVGGTGGTSDRITFRDERSTVWSVNSLTGSVTLGVGQLSDVNFEDAPEQNQFLQWNGVDEWRPAYAVTSLNNQIGSVTLTGDGESLIGRTNNKFTNRLATTGVTGVASFLSNHFTVSETGHVSSKGVITINNTSPDGNGNFNVAAATVVTGDGGSLRGDGVVITARFSSTGISGVASFNSSYFTVGATGHVSLATAYQATGDTVITTAGSGISVSANKTITNIGVTGFNGLTGSVSLTGCGGAVRGSDNTCITVRNSSTTLTGVASFNSTYFSVGSSGHVLLSAAYQATGDNSRIATAALTGVASFDPRFFTVGSTGHVILTSAYQATGDTVITVAGSGIAISANKTITNIGVTSFNGLTGIVSLTGCGGAVRGSDNSCITVRNASGTLTGVASFNPTYFTVGATGHVLLSAAYQATGDTVITVAGSGILLSTSGKTKTIFNIGVTGFNGLTGNITVTGDGGSLVVKDNNKFTNRITYLWDDTASPPTGLTGVSMFNCRDFTVDAAGLISLAAFSQCNGGGGGCDCSQYTTEGACLAAECGWACDFNG